jgi:uncharacterized protein YndB with AHSA1/START domain
MFTEPRELARWWGPRGFTIRAIELAPVVGGRYRISMQPPEGDVFHLAGEFLELDPPRRLVFTFRWEEPTPDDRETVAAIDLRAVSNGTAVSVSQGVFATDERLSLHRGGWTESLEKLRDLLADRRHHDLGDRVTRS